MWRRMRLSHRAKRIRRIGWRSLVSTGVLLFLILLTVFFIWQANCQQGPSAIGQLRQITGISVSMGKEESDFYRTLAQKELTQQGAAAPSAGNAELYASKVYACFLAGERLGVCSPYSFEGLKADMAKDNQERLAQKEQGKKLEGPEQYDLPQYLRYRLDEVRDAIVDKLAENPSHTLQQNSRAYWESNRDQFAVVREITVDMKQNKSEKKIMFKKGDINKLKEGNPQLYEILSNAKEGQTFEYEYDGDTISGEILSVKKETADYEEVTQQVLIAYLAKVEYPQLIDLIAINNPVQLTK